MRRGIDEHGAKKRSFTSAVGYAYCFRTYSLYLSFRHGVLILYRRATFLLRGRQGRSRAVHIVTALLSTEVKPAFGGLPSSVTVQRKSAAPRHLPQGEGFAPVTSVPRPYKNVPRPAAHLNISPFWGEIFHTRKARISPCRRHDFTRGFAADFTAALRAAYLPAAPPQATEFSKVRTAVKPALAGCPHPSRCSAKAQRRLAFPKRKAKRLRRHRTALPRNRKIYFSFLWLFARRIFSGRRGKISPKGSFEKVVIK